MSSKYFKKALQQVPDDSKVFVKKSLDIAETIHAILETKGISQKELATKLGKSESEISKWLSGLHNFTLKSLAKLEVVLGEDIFMVTKFTQKHSEHLDTEETVEFERV
jgi:transcriptional regulator with XRE-family HTH domain